MLLVSAVQIAIGWAWHTAHRARLHWTLKREGALIAAAAIAMIGGVETIRSASHGKGAPAPIVSPALTAMATPVFTEETPLEVLPPGSIETIEAVPSPPVVEPLAAADPIAGKIMERLGEPATGSVGDEPVKKIKAKPAKKTRKPVKPSAD